MLFRTLNNEANTYKSLQFLVEINSIIVVRNSNNVSFKISFGYGAGYGL